MTKRQIHHVTIRVNDARAARIFYDAVLGALSMTSNVDEHGRSSFGIGGRHDFGFYAEGEEFFQRPHVAFDATSQAEVDAFHAAALAAGGRSLDSPRARPEFGGLYSAYVEDPDGNVLEVTYPGSTEGDAER